MWPWVLFGESLHRFVDHSWEMILLNSSHGLATKNESSCEAVHNEEEYDREHLARKTDLKSNLTDIFNRQFVTGDPGIRKHDKEPQCSKCHSKDHFTVSCPKKTATAIQRDDSMVLSFLIGKEDEEPEFQKSFIDKVKKSWGI